MRFYGMWIFIGGIALMIPLVQFQRALFQIFPDLTEDHLIWTAMSVMLIGAALYILGAFYDSVSWFRSNRSEKK